jgi:hypothetical protein
MTQATLRPPIRHAPNLGIGNDMNFSLGSKPAERRRKSNFRVVRILVVRHSPIIPGFGPHARRGSSEQGSRPCLIAFGPAISRFREPTVPGDKCLVVDSDRPPNGPPSTALTMRRHAACNSKML